MHKSFLKRFIVAFSSFSSLLGAAAQAASSPLPFLSYSHRPKLILVLVVDQFRADYLTRFQSRFLPAHASGGAVGGYNYLMSQGAYFPQAEYGVFQNMTGPGHSMILSGSYPYQTGITLNTWYDTQGGHPEYCVADGAAISPKNFLGTTVGDELKNAGYPSRVVSVSLKDRAAVLMGGQRADLALWMDPVAFHWTSGPRYLHGKPLPEWVTQTNIHLDSLKGQTYTWRETGKATGLTLGASGDFNRATPIGGKESLSMPFGLDLTERMAASALDAFKLGAGKNPDLLAVSFSSHDYMGHLYGPNTREMEEMTVAEDRTISHMLNTVRAKVPGGLNEVLVVLTADHGIPPSSSWLRTVGIEAGKIDGGEAAERIEKLLTGKFGAPEDGEKWIPYNVDLNFYVNPRVIARKKLLRETVENEVKQELLKIQGVAFVFTRTEAERKTLPPGLVQKQIFNGYYPGRSGDVVIIPKAFYAAEDDPVVHMTGYSYDRTVPLIFSGRNIKKGVYSTHADIVDIAPTLSFLLGTIPPSLSEGRVLSEILGE